MRMTNEAFEAEVRRRAAAYQNTERQRRRRILMTACPIAACFLLVVGVAAFRRPDRMFSNSANMTAEAPAATKGNEENREAQKDDTLRKTAKPSLDAAQPCTTSPQNNHMAATARDDSKSQLANDAQEQPAAIEQDGYSNAAEIAGDAVSQTLVLSCSMQTIPKGTKQLDLQVTNRSDQTVILSSAQFVLKQFSDDGKCISYTQQDPQKETRIAVGAGNSVPFGLTLSWFAEDLPAGRYALRLENSEISFVIE